MNKRIKTAAGSVALVSASLLGGGLFAATAVNAQVDDAPVETVLDGDGVEAPADVPEDADTADAPEDGRRGRHGHHGQRGDRGAQAVETAGLLGIEVDELRTALHDGDTLAEVAEANGVDPQTIIDAKVDSATERIQAKVDAGDITQEQADEKLADLEERVTTRVNEGRPERGERRGPAADADSDTDG